MAFLPGEHGQNLPLLLKSRKRVETVLADLGLSRNPAKGHWEPTKTCEHLGLIVSTTNNGGEYSVPLKKLQRIRQFAVDLKRDSLQRRRLCPVRRLASFTGLCQSVYLVLPCARMFLRSIHDSISTKQGWDSNLRLSRQVYRDLDWWSLLPEKSIGRSLWTQPTTKTISSDASGFASGGVYEGKWAHGRFSQEQMPHHITVKEFIAAHKVIETFLPQLQGQRVRFHEDNQAVVYMVRSRTSRSPVLMRLIRRFFAMLDLHSIKVTMEYIKSALNESDAPSRLIDKSDWQLSPSVWHTIDQLHGPHTHDCSATTATSQCPKHDSRYRTPQCRT